jgi:hypothetical protein
VKEMTVIHQIFENKNINNLPGFYSRLQAGSKK